MDWISGIQRAIDYTEEHLTEKKSLRNMQTLMNCTEYSESAFRTNLKTKAFRTA